MFVITQGYLSQLVVTQGYTGSNVVPVGPFFIEAGQTFAPGSVRQQNYTAGEEAVQSFSPGAVQGEVSV